MCCPVWQVLLEVSVERCILVVPLPLLIQLLLAMFSLHRQRAELLTLLIAHILISQLKPE